MRFESFFRSNGDILSATIRTFVEVFAQFFSNFLWRKANGLNYFFTIFAPKRHLPAIIRKRGFALFPKGRHIDEIGIIHAHTNFVKIFLRRCEHLAMKFDFWHPKFQFLRVKTTLLFQCFPHQKHSLDNE